jgi:hypothetical protein
MDQELGLAGGQSVAALDIEAPLQSGGLGDQAPLEELPQQRAVLNLQGCEAVVALVVLALVPASLA